MKNTKLYVLQNNGIVKLGITRNDNVKTRINQINKNLYEDKRFELVVDFEVNKSPAMIERLIHDYLGINQLNLQYLKNKMVLVNVDYLDSSQTGYTEFFLADKDKIKQVITLFGILDYINFDTQSLNKLNDIKEYSFDFFAENYPTFLKMCEPTIYKNQNSDNYIKSTLAETLNNESAKVKCDFIIEDNKYYLLLENSKISIEELTNSDNEQYVEKLLLNKDKLEIKNKEGQTLYEIIREFKENNKETSLQPLVAMQKELKEEQFHKFMNDSDGYNKVFNLIKDFDWGNVFAYELIGFENSYLNAHKELLSENKNITKQELNKTKQNIKILQAENIFKPNFNSPKLFPELFKLIEKDNIVLKSYDYYIGMLESSNMISSIFKILYNSKNKEADIQKIDEFMTSVDNYCKKLYNNENINLKEDPSFWKLEDSILGTCKANNVYFELAETVIKPYGLPEKNEKRLLNKIKNK